MIDTRVATSTDQRSIALEHAIDQDQQAHVEDDITVNAIRDGKIIQIPWNQLTEAEQRAARINYFQLY